LEDGRACPTCRDRLLDALPPLFPGFAHLLERESASRRPTEKRASKPKLSVSAPKKQRKGRKSDPK
jgi:hypothetical protein